MTARNATRGRPPGAGNAWRKVNGEPCTVADIAARLGVAAITARKYYNLAARGPGAVTWRALQRLRDNPPAVERAPREPSARARKAARLRDGGRTWSDVGAALGVSRQRAQQLGERGAHA